VPNNALNVEFDENAIDAVFSCLNQCLLPGAAVGIAIDGKPVYRKGFGLANMELPVALSASTRMRIASVTKHFSCLAYLLLCEEGRCELDDPIGKFLPEIHRVTGAATMRQLMGNISGIRDVMDVCHRFSGLGKMVTSAELVALYRDIDTVNAAPGTNWIYNNGGWLLLTEAIDRITGRSYEEVMRDLIFEPVGMYDTLIRRWDTNFVPNSAAPHMMNAAGVYEKNWDGMDGAGAGSMVSTVDDMLRWLAHMDSPVIGSEATWATLKRPQALSNGSSTGYAMGLYVGRYHGADAIHHAGNLSGVNAQMLKIPAARLDIVVMLNRGDMHAVEFAKKVMDACLPDRREQSRAPRDGFVSGVFRSPSTGRVIELFARDGRQIACVDSLDFELERDDDGVWVTGAIWEGLVKQTITIVGHGSSPAAIQFSYFGNVDELHKVKPGNGANIVSIAGRYEAPAVAAEATVFDTAEGPRIRTTGSFGSVVCDLEYLAEGIWRARFTKGLIPAGGILSFDAEARSFRFSSWQTWSLSFRRCL
jgi:CubicO group peptidase (beta-lactamase class C family)